MSRKLSNIYNSEFQSLVGRDAQKSALTIVPLILDLVKPKSIIDVGCGTGGWLKQCLDLGVEDILGIDGPWVKPELLLIPAEKFVTTDLSKPLHIKRTFDVVLCLEVAEHLPSSSATGLVRSLVKLGPVIVFSAAIPEQGGTNHINEQWLDYWSKKFKACGYILIDALRPIIWDSKDIEWWYAQNMVIFINKEKLNKYKKLLAIPRETASWSYRLIHPRHYQELKNLIYEEKIYIKELEKKANLNVSKCISFILEVLKTKINKL